ncbi:MAG: DUF2442 domain-containing protein [Chloroflexi bacterium]|nr:DUF2442 domain-containing protein [Chloroflexota bacterium]
MIRVRAVEPLDDFRVRLEFTNNTSRVIDLEPFFHGPIFEPIRRDQRLFRAVRVDPELGTIVWPNGADIDPDVLSGERIPSWLEAGRTAHGEPPSERA